MKEEPDLWTNPGAAIGRRMLQPGLYLFVSDLDRREQQDAADGKGGDNIEKRSHGFSPCFNACQTSLFLRNLQAANGRTRSGFQLRTENSLLHVLQLGTVSPRRCFANLSEP